ncbi:MAG: SpoIIE family protein phosphatase [Nocardioides sp.]
MSPVTQPDLRPRLTPVRPRPTPTDETRGERFDRVVRLAQQLFGVPVVAVNLVDERTQSSLAIVGFEHLEVPRGDTFCAITVDSGEALVVTDAAADERFKDNPYVTGFPFVRFYAGQPLFEPGGRAVGTLCLIDQHPRPFSKLEARLLRDLADWVEQELVADADGAQAREVQRRLLPRHEIVVPGYDLAGESVPARNVGGDYFDWQILSDDVVQVVVADVMGKGMEAAVVAAGLRTVIRGSSRFNDLAQSIGRAALSMEDDFTDTGTFVTLFAARLTPSTGDLEYVDAGHGLALVIEAGGDVRRLVSHDLPVGAVPGGTWEPKHDRLEPGDTLLVVSDGILDLFPDARAAVKAGIALSADARDAHEMARRIAGVGNGSLLDDDITVVAVRRDAQ